MNQVTYSGDIYASMRQIALPADVAQKATDLLKRMGSNQLPPTDQELYNKALGLVSATSSAEVQKAVDIFELISDFKDAPQQKDIAEKRLAEVVQAEKEAAIIGKERSKKVTIISTILAIIALIVGAYFFVTTTHAKAIENLPNVNSQLGSYYVLSDKIKSKESYHRRVYVKIDTSKKTLSYEQERERYDSRLRKQVWETDEDQTYSYKLEVSGMSGYVLTAGKHKFTLKISDGVVTTLTETTKSDTVLEKYRY